MTIAIDPKILATLIACTKAHIEDVESGIREGLYEASDNEDLTGKQQALACASELIDPPEAPPGGYFIMLDHEQTVDHCDTLTQARTLGQRLCDAEPLPGAWSILDAEGKFVEEILRSDAKTLDSLVKEFAVKATG